MSTPILTELAAPVIAMAQAHCTYLDTMRQTDTADANRTALVAFKRALKEADVPAPTLTVPATEVPADDAAQLEHRTRMRGELLNGLARAINATSTENASSTPDFILANFAAACLDAFAEASLAHEAWYGKSLSIGGESATAPTAHDALIAEADMITAWTSTDVQQNPGAALHLVSQLRGALTAERAARVAADQHDYRKLTCMGVGDGSGQLFVYGNYESIKAAQNKLLARDAAIARAERAERERAETAGSLIRCRQTFSQELDTLRTQLDEALEELARLRGGLYDVAEGDCSYGDNCPGGQAGRHGQCHVCHCREVLGITAVETLSGARRVLPAKESSDV